MFVITNRNLQPDNPPVERFGEGFNELGPKELRLGEAKKTSRGWRLTILDDQVIHDGEAIYASEMAFLTLLKRARRYKKNCLFFVHGYNNNFEEVLERGHTLEQLYNVEVILFSWPANGGGIRGVLDYKSDKQDAVLSVNALDRALAKLDGYLRKYGSEDCTVRVSMLLHSMGNYLFKNLLKSSIYQAETVIFDNIIMAAADVNNEGHAEWVERISFRKRLLITINEDDHCLFASRAKVGAKQKARLGHFPYELNAGNATYLNFSAATHVGISHAYFEGDAIRNKRVRKVFDDAFNGLAAEQELPYQVHSNCFTVP